MAYIQDPNFPDERLQDATIQRKADTVSKLPRPDEFQGGKKKFDDIVSRIREKQQMAQIRENDKPLRGIDARRDTPLTNVAPTNIANKRHNFKYGYPLQRKSSYRSNGHSSSLSSSMKSSIHSDINEINVAGMRYDNGHKHKDMNLSRQYSIMEDNFDENISTDTSTNVRAVNRSSISTMESKNGIM